MKRQIGLGVMIAVLLSASPMARAQNTPPQRMARWSPVRSAVPQRAKAPQPRASTVNTAVSPEALLAAHRSRAERQILIAVRGQNAFQRSNAIEAGAYLPRRAPSLVAIGLRDQSPAVRFAALAMMGKLKLRQMTTAARPLLNDPNESVRAAALFAMHMCGHKVDLTPMASYLASQDSRVKANAALLMGMTGDPKALLMVREMASQTMSRSTGQERKVLVRLQFAEVMVKLGNESSLDAIRASAFSQFPEVQVFAVTMLGRLQDRDMEAGIVPMLAKKPIELQLAAAEALARMGRYDGLDVLVEACASQQAPVRAQAAAALGRFRQPGAAQALAKLLDDPSGQVRVAAAASVLSWGRNNP